MGNRCHFAHGDAELRSMNDVSLPALIPQITLFFLAHPLRSDGICC